MSNTVDKTLRLDRSQLGQKRPQNKPPTLLWAFAAAAAAAVFVAIFVFTHRPAQTATAPPPVTQVDVVLAAEEIPIHTVLTADMLRVDKLPQDKVPAGAATNVNDVVGKTALTSFMRNDVLRADAILAPDTSAFSMNVKPQMRAITIGLDPVSSVNGFVKPGDHVDIIGIFDSGNNQSVTRYVLQDVELLASGSQTLPRAPDPNAPPTNGTQPADVTGAKPVEVPNATISVSPVDAAKVFAAADKGKLRLALRYPSDHLLTMVPTINSSAVTGVTPPAPPAPPKVTEQAPPPPPNVIPLPPSGPSLGASGPLVPMSQPITVIRGTDSHTVTVPS